VTGGAGFLARILRRLLGEGANVICVDKNDRQGCTQTLALDMATQASSAVATLLTQGRRLSVCFLPPAQRSSAPESPGAAFCSA
jgi:hypothetical protein